MQQTQEQREKLAQERTDKIKKILAETGMKQYVVLGFSDDRTMQIIVSPDDDISVLGLLDFAKTIRREVISRRYNKMQDHAEGELARRAIKSIQQSKNVNDKPFQ